VKTVEGGSVSPKELALLESGESPLFAARPSYATVDGGDHWDLPLLLLTDRRMLISKAKLIGRPKADFSAPWVELGPVEGKPWGSQIQLVVQWQHGSIELIVQPAFAVDVESSIRSGYVDRS
jgi:hypothetical protein